MLDCHQYSDHNMLPDSESEKNHPSLLPQELIRHVQNQTTYCQISTTTSLFLIRVFLRYIHASVCGVTPRQSQNSTRRRESSQLHAPLFLASVVGVLFPATAPMAQKTLTNEGTTRNTNQPKKWMIGCSTFMRSRQKPDVRKGQAAFSLAPKQDYREISHLLSLGVVIESLTPKYFLTPCGRFPS